MGLRWRHEARAQAPFVYFVPFVVPNPGFGTTDGTLIADESAFTCNFAAVSKRLSSRLSEPLSVILTSLGILSQAGRDVHVLMQNADDAKRSTREFTKEKVVVLVTNEEDAAQ